MAKFKQIIKTNVPFTTTKCQMLFYIPEGVTIDVWASVEGNDWEDITGKWYGGQLCSIVAIPEGTYFKFVSSEDINISIFK